MNNIRHSVLVVSYNQQQYIKASLDSLINQSVPPDEIIVGDDSSTDGTWDVIVDYVNKYPGLINAYRNVANIGLFQNFNKIKRMASGDMISYLAGDDMFDPDFIKNMNDFLEKNSICNFSEKFIVITNSMVLENELTTLCDNYQYRDLPAIKSLIRGSLKIWDTGISRGLFHSMPDSRTDLGNHADSLQFFERFMMADKVVFAPVVGYKYRKNVGVTARADHRLQSSGYIAVLKIMKNTGLGVLDEIDINYLDFLINYFEYVLDHSARNYLKFLKSRFKNCAIPSGSSYSSLLVYVPITLKIIFKKLL